MKRMNFAAKGAMFACLLLLSIGRAFAGPVVLNSAIDNGQVTINGTGFVSPLTVQLNGKKLTVVSSTATQITANLGAPLAQGTYRLVVVAGTARTAYDGDSIRHHIGVR
jgi:IPT/TIG domain